MKITYDTETDALRIILIEVAIDESDEDKLGSVLDFDAAGNVVGTKILDTFHLMENPKAVEYTVVG